MTQTNLTPDAYRERDTAILRFVGTYGVGLIQAINHVIGEGKQLGHVVRRLAEDGLLQLQARALEGGVSYCRLTPIGAERAQVPKDRATKELGVQALDKLLAVMTWCCFGKCRRYRIERSEMAAILPETRFPTNQVHCVSFELGYPAVHRVQLVQGGLDLVVKSLRQELENAQPELRAAIEACQYRVVLLVDSAVKANALTATLNRGGLSESGRVSVDVSATACTVAAYLRDLRKQERRAVQ